jgi:hypothetical protein
MRLDRRAEEAVCGTLDRYGVRYGAKDVDGITELFADASAAAGGQPSGAAYPVATKND